MSNSTSPVADSDTLPPIGETVEKAIFRVELVSKESLSSLGKIKDFPSDNVLHMIKQAFVSNRL